MPSAPQILPTQIPQGTAPGVTYRLEGELVPVLHMALDGQVPVYFEHHVLLWKYPQLQIGLHPLGKGLKRRVFGGMPLLLLSNDLAQKDWAEFGPPRSKYRHWLGSITPDHEGAGYGIAVPRSTSDIHHRQKDSGFRTTSFQQLHRRMARNRRR